MQDASRKQLERAVYDRQLNLERPSYDSYWDPELYARMCGYELERDLERMAADHLHERRVLVLGASVGDVRLVARHSRQITALNISERELAAVTREFPQVETLLADAESHHPETRWQALYCHSILHHLLPFEAVAERLAGWLEPGGVLLVGSEPGRLNPPAALARRFTPSQSHTPGEQPFVFGRFERVLKRHFEPLEQRRYFLSSMLWPWLARRAPALRGPCRVGLDLNLRCERLLRRLPLLDELYWVLAGAWRRR